MATKKSVSLSVGRGEKLPVSKGAGLTAKGREKYNRETGSNLKAPAPNPKTDADGARKKSFCSRMGAVADLGLTAVELADRRKGLAHFFPFGAGFLAASRCVLYAMATACF